MHLKTIAVDLRCLPLDGTMGAGVEHAARELWQALYDNRGQFYIELLGLAPRGAFLEREEGIIRLPNAAGGALRNILREKNGSINGLFVPSGAVAWGIDLPVFPWVHDLAIFEHPEWFPQSWIKRQLTTRLYLRGLRQAKHLFAVSQDTKDSIHRIARIDPSKITVTYQGSTSQGNEMPSDVLSIPSSYALILGTLEPRKNIQFICDLWPEVERCLGRSLGLIFAGREGWGDVKIPAYPSFHRIQNINDRTRNELIRRADILLLPSLHEGFGRLALEAMQLGTPVIASDRGALPEVIEQGGQVISLDRQDLWMKAVIQLVSSPVERVEWATRGKRQAAKFSWQRVAQTILAKLSEN